MLTAHPASRPSLYVRDSADSLPPPFQLYDVTADGFEARDLTAAQVSHVARERGLLASPSSCRKRRTVSEMAGIIQMREMKENFVRVEAERPAASETAPKGAPEQVYANARERWARGELSTDGLEAVVKSLPLGAPDGGPIRELEAGHSGEHMRKGAT